MCLQYPVRVVRASVWYESLHSTVKRAFWRPFIIKHIATKHSGGDNGSEQSKLLQAPVSLHSREVCKILGWMIFLMLLFLKMSCIKITRSRYFLWHESSKSRVEAVVKIPALEKSVGFYVDFSSERADQSVWLTYNHWGRPQLPQKTRQGTLTACAVQRRRSWYWFNLIAVCSDLVCEGLSMGWSYSHTYIHPAPLS